MNSFKQALGNAGAAAIMTLIQSAAQGAACGKKHACIQPYQPPVQQIPLGQPAQVQPIPNAQPGPVNVPIPLAPVNKGPLLNGS